MRFVSRPDEDAVFEFEGCRRDDEVIGGNQLATPTELSVKIRPSFRCTKSKINDGRRREQCVDLRSPPFRPPATLGHLHPNQRVNQPPAEKWLDRAAT